MIITPRAIEQISDRIERAFLRRRPEWRQVGLDPRLWSASAAILMDARLQEPWVPLDPELFVACQTTGATSTDPWRELTRGAARRRYLCQVRRIVLGLRRELRQELRRVDTLVHRGESLDIALLRPSRHLSPLGCYLAASRCGRSDLSDHFLAAARVQHEACPLYRRAAIGLIPDADYPVLPLFPELLRSPGSFHFSLN